jgi:AraC-like DNA-binding protein
LGDIVSLPSCSSIAKRSNCPRNSAILPSTIELQARLGRACTLLDEIILPIDQIAPVLGYDDVFLFSGQFK